MIVKYNKKLLKYFKALFADIFNQKRKKMHYLQTEEERGKRKEEAGKNSKCRKTWFRFLSPAKTKH